MSCFSPIIMVFTPLPQTDKLDVDHDHDSDATTIHLQSATATTTRHQQHPSSSKLRNHQSINRPSYQKHSLNNNSSCNHNSSVMFVASTTTLVVCCVMLALMQIEPSQASRLWNTNNQNQHHANNHDQYFTSNTPAAQTFSHLDRPLNSEMNNQGYHDRWVRDNGDSNSIDSNEIEPSKPSSGKRDYACGRAIAIDRQRSHYYTRNKYRPLEIRMPRIIGGDETEAGEFPWIASIKLNGQPICGGSLIDKRWVLTAAHCVVGYNPKNLTVKLGSYRIKDINEVQSIELPVNMFIVHKDYSVPRPFSNDIALLKLSDQIRFSDYIIPVCLPYEDQLFGHASQLSSIGGSVATSLDDFRNQILNNLGYDAIDPSVESGIVVSTKMSDLDIAMCFNKLEQNYLASIGISPTPVVGASDYQASSSSDTQPQTYAASPQEPSTGYRPTSSSQNPSESNDNNNNNNIFSYHDVFNSILMPIQGDKDKLTLFTPVASNQEFTTNKQVDNGNQQDYLAWSSQVSPPVPHSNVHSTLVKRSDIGPETSKQAKGLAANEDDDDVVGSNNNNADARTRQLKSAHKLSRLPISNELIKEIHDSVSSNPIGPFASIGQTDIAAMASDLIHSSSQPVQSHPQAPSQQNAHHANHDQGSNSLIGDDHQFHHSSSNYREKITNGATPYDTMSTSSQANSNNFDLFGSGSNEDLNGIANNQLTTGGSLDDPTSYAGLSGIVVGWGWIKELEADDANNTKGTPSVTLQKVRLPVLRNKVCESWFQSQSKKITLLPSQFCAGLQAGGKDACRGDSGGPMIIEDSTDTGRYKLIGIVSAGIGCARPSLPGLYTRVASFLPWINAQISRY